MPGGDEAVTQIFPDAHHQIAPDLWAIGSPLLTCFDVCQRLGVDEGRRMVVAPMSEYYGRFDRALWQKLDAWGRE